MSPEIYGQYKLIFSIIGIIGALSVTGSPLVITRSIAKGYDGTFIKQILLQLKTSVFPIVVGSGVGIYYILNTNYTLGSGIIIASILSPLLVTANLYGSFLEGKKNFSLLVKYQLIHGTVPIILLVLSIFFTDNIFIILLAYFIPNILIHSLFTLRTLKHNVENQMVDVEANNYSLHLSVQGLIGPIATNIDKIIIFHFFGAAQLALYVVAVALPQQVSIVQKGLKMIMLPNLSQRSLKMIKNSAKQRALILFAAGIFLSFGYILIAPILFKVFFPNYIEGIFISQLYSLSFLFLPKMIYSIGLYAQKMTRGLYISKISTPVIKIILFIILTPTYGLIGAVVSILLTQLIELLILIILLHRSKIV